MVKLAAPACLFWPLLRVVFLSLCVSLSSFFSSPSKHQPPPPYLSRPPSLRAPVYYALITSTATATPSLSFPYRH